MSDQGHMVDIDNVEDAANLAMTAVMCVTAKVQSYSLICILTLECRWGYSDSVSPYKNFSVFKF